MDLERDIKDMVRTGAEKSDICRRMLMSYQAVDPEIIKDLVDAVCDNYPDYKKMRFILESKIIVDQQSKDGLVIVFNPTTRKLEKMTSLSIRKMLRDVDLSESTYTCEFVYKPFIFSKLIKGENGYSYNTYEPPVWFEDHFYSEGKIPVEPMELPENFKTFLNHLVDGKMESYEYVLDWTANALQNRNYCILATIGAQGIGKGVLSAIFNKLFGDYNYSKTDNRIVKKEFNAQIKNKRLTYIDELKISTIEEEGRLKDLINDKLEIEQKGKDATLMDNYCSIYISSNELDAFRISADDRRFSVIDLTDKKLTEILTSEQISDLTSEETIKAIAHNLYNRAVDSSKILRVFKSQRTEEVRSSSLKEWEMWVIDEFSRDNQGKDMLVKELGTAIKDELDMKNTVGRNKLKQLSNVYPHIFKVYCNNKKEWRVKFSKQQDEN